MQRRLKISSYRYDRKGRGGAEGGFIGFDLFGRRWGFDRSTVYVGEEKYLDRWILYVNGYTLRLHKFYRGDDDRASHTHPWWFVTFPLTGYYEQLAREGAFYSVRYVQARRPHYRPANFEHYVLWSAHGGAEPWWTIVLTGQKSSSWGFYPEPGKFVSWKEWQ